MIGSSLSHIPFFFWFGQREAGVHRRRRDFVSNLAFLLHRLEKPLNFVLLGGGQALAMLALITQFLFMVYFVLLRS